LPNPTGPGSSQFGPTPPGIVWGNQKGQDELAEVLV
jgi:hypothetical protein